MIWTELFDEDDNRYYEAHSPYHDDGSPIMWRLRQRIVDGVVEWYEDHDSELMDGPPDRWEFLESAKEDIQDAHEEIIRHEDQPKM